MVNLGIAKLLNEARSKNRYLHTVSNAFASYVLKELKESPTTIQNNNFTIDPKEFLNDVELSKLKNLRSITLFFIKEPDLDHLVEIPSAGYYAQSGSEEYGEKEYDFERGEISFEILIHEGIQNFDELEKKYNYLYNSLSELFRHEIEHYIDDESIEGGLLSQRKDRSPYFKLTQQQKDEFNYYARPYEIKAYVKQFMEEARRNKQEFHKVLINYLKTNQEFSTFNKNPKLKDILYLLIFKYLEYGSIVYNSVRENEEAMGYLQKLGRYLDNKGLYMPEEIDESIKYFKDFLSEAKKLSKYWSERSKKRAKRAGRRTNNKIDKAWAEEQQDKSRDIGEILNKSYESDIKETEELTRELEELLSVSQAKKQDAFLNKPFGRSKGFKKNARKHKGQGAVARGERFGPFGPSALEETNEN